MEGVSESAPPGDCSCSRSSSHTFCTATGIVQHRANDCVALGWAAPACPSSPVMCVVSPGHLHGKRTSLGDSIPSRLCSSCSSSSMSLVTLLRSHVNVPPQTLDRGATVICTYRSGDVVPDDSTDCFFFRGMPQPSQPSLPAPLRARASAPHQPPVWPPPASRMAPAPSQGGPRAPTGGSGAAVRRQRRSRTVLSV